MRQLLFLILLYGLFASPALAQTATAPADSTVFAVTDVAVDVTADSAAHARDKAVVQAQHQAFDQLLDRLGADKSWSARIGDDDLATLVQNFEVQNERSSSVRYLGTFTVQFRPNAVRKLLGAKNARFIDTQSKPMLVLPVFYSKDHPILWEEATRWRSAWDKRAGNNAGLVPTLLPSGGLDDISLLSTTEAVNGKSDALHALIDKYHAGGAVVASLHGDLDKLADPLIIDVQSYDADGAPTDTSQLTQPPASKAGLDDTLAQAVRQVRSQLEKDWRQQLKNNAKDDPAPAPVIIDANSAAPIAQLPVLVPISTLSDLAQTKQSLSAVPNVQRVDVINLARGAAHIQIGFHGNIADLQNAVHTRNLDLSQDPLSGGWVLRIAGQTSPVNGPN